MKQLKTPTKNCLECFNDYKDKSLRNIIVGTENICDKCFNQLSIKFYSFKVDGISCLSLYDYDDYFRSRLFQFKGCYDIALAKSFIETYIAELTILYWGYIIIPIPSNKEDDEERGFNHVVEVFKNIPLTMEHVFIKNKLHKQSDQSFEKRNEIHHVIDKIDSVKLKDKKVLLVDDVITSGNTIKRCINLLREKGCKKIKVLTLSASKHLEKGKESFIKKVVEKMKK